MHHRPAVMHMDGVEWVEKSAYDAAMSALQEKQRSTASHNRWFAHIYDMFENLPASHAQAPYAASSDAFRKYALIQGGYCETECHAFDSIKDMMAMGPKLKAHAQKGHGFALCHYRGNVLTLSTPESQSFKAMGKERFHASVAACEDWAERLLGVKP